MQHDNKYPAMCWNWRFLKLIWTVLCLTWSRDATVLFSPGSSHQHHFQWCSHNFKWDTWRKRPQGGLQSLIGNSSFQLCLSPLLIPVACIKDTVCLSLWYWTCWGEVLGRPLNVSACVFSGWARSSSRCFGGGFQIKKRIEQNRTWMFSWQIQKNEPTLILLHNTWDS